MPGKKTAPKHEIMTQDEEFFDIDSFLEEIDDTEHELALSFTTSIMSTAIELTKLAAAIEQENKITKFDRKAIFALFSESVEAVMDAMPG